MQRYFAAFLVWLVIGTSSGLARPEQADLQFFGDVLITSKALRQTHAQVGEPAVFAESLALLRSSRHNIANLEGVISSSLPPLAWKQYFLRMPPSAAMLLKWAGIDAVTLANNHVLDYGFAGLLSSLSALAKARIASTGAGINLMAATTPLVIDLGEHKACLLAFSKTLPSSFWATSKRAGTAFAEETLVVSRVRECRQLGYYTIVALHWGREGDQSPSFYQRDLAHVIIDAGANLVIGHHPHVVQEIEYYKNSPIFYSLGNFAFGTEPIGNEQQGIAVRLSFIRELPFQPNIEVVPLLVDNQTVKFMPRPWVGIEPSQLAKQISSSNRCTWAESTWFCN